MHKRNCNGINSLTYLLIHFQNESFYEELPDAEKTSQQSATVDVHESFDSSMFYNIIYLNQLSIGIVNVWVICSMYDVTYV